MKRENIFIGLFFLVIAFVFALPIFRHFGYWGIQDWDQHFFYQAVARETVLEFRQFPLWNPYTCGGTVSFANPQSRFLSPFFILSLLFGAVRGIKLEIWLHLAVGLLGAYRLARRYRLGVPASLVSSFLFMLSSMYSLSLTVGMTWFLSVAYLPWVFLFYLKAFSDLKYSFLGGFSLALVFLEGGAYPLAMMVLFLGLYSLLAVSLEKAGILKTGKLLGIVLIYALCLGAVKFIPAADFLRGHPRRVDDYSGFSVKSLRFSLFSRDQTLDAVKEFPHPGRGGFTGGISYFMDENGMYVGVLPFLLILLGLVLRGRRRPALLLCLVIFLWLSFGNRAPVSLWPLVHRLPGFDSMRVAQRFRIVVMFCFALFAGFGLQGVKEYVSGKGVDKKTVRFLCSVVAAAVLFDLWLVDSRVFKDAFPIPPIPTKRSDEFYQVRRLPSYDKNGLVAHEGCYTSFGSLYPAFLSNVGVIEAYETSIVPQNAVPRGSAGYRGEIFLEGTEGEVRLKRWSPNRIVVRVNAAGKGHLVLNQNYYPGWKVKGGDEPGGGPLRGLVAAKVASGVGEVELYYLPTSFIVGAMISGATLLVSVVGLLGLIFKRRRE